MTKTILIFIGLCLIMTDASADWSKKEIDAVTNKMQEYSETWTTEDTINTILDTTIVSGMFSQAIITKKGNVSVVVTGNSVLINGVDVTGNLGKKEIHESFSHFFEKVEIKITIFSITFISIGFIIYLLINRTKKRKS